MARNKQDNISESFFKTCKICGKKFQPIGRYQRLCKKCLSIHWTKRKEILNSRKNEN